MTLALVVAARFGLLLGLALWIGLALAAPLLAPVLFSKLERASAEDVAGAIFRRVDHLLLASMALVFVALVARVALDRAAPHGGLLAPTAAMAAARLVAAMAVAPAREALRVRLRDANAPASDAERTAFRRLHGAWLLLVSLELGLGLYALYTVS